MRESSPFEPKQQPSQDEQAHEAGARRGQRVSTLTFLWRSKTGLYGLSIVVLFSLIALAAPMIAPHDPLTQDLSLRLTPPFWQPGGNLSYPLGTDGLGRDILSRIIWGSRISLLVGLSAVAVGASVGVLLGLMAGYLGGAVDNIVMRLVDIQLALPSLVLAIAIMAILGPGLLNLILCLSVTGWVVYTRMARGDTLTVRTQEFVQAAHVIGASPLRIMLRHILPNIMNAIIVVASFSVAHVIIAEASLSFLGIGVPPPTPTWGNMLADGRDYLSNAWWVATWPGIALMITLLGINLLGDWIRDLLDPKLRNL